MLVGELVQLQSGAAMEDSRAGSDDEDDGAVWVIQELCTSGMWPADVVYRFSRKQGNGRCRRQVQQRERGPVRVDVEMVGTSGNELGEQGKWIIGLDRSG